MRNKVAWVQELSMITSDSKRREEERRAVLDYWDDEMLDLADRYLASWHSLTEPAMRFKDIEDKELVYVRAKEMCRRVQRWPTVDFWRRLYGVAPTTRRPGEHPTQTTLDVS